MKIKTVKVEPPKGYRHMRNMNAGIANNLMHYIISEEHKQIIEIVYELIDFTNDLNIIESLRIASVLVNESENTSEIKNQIFRKYCEIIFERKGLPTETV